MSVDVSVIIPTFHREKQVALAVKSALRQEDVSVEVVVLDDSAEGSAFEAVTAIGDCRVRYVKHGLPSGGRPAIVRNEGARLGLGRFLHFLDDDDILESEALCALLEVLRDRSSAGMAFGAIVPFGEDEGVLRRQQRYFFEATREARGLRGRLDLAAQLLFRNTVLVNSACMVRREAFEAVGGYDAEVPINEDVELWLRVARSTGFAYLDRPIVRYRTGAPSLRHDSLATNGAGREKSRAAYARMYGKYRSDYGLVEFYFLKAFARTVMSWR